VRTGGLENARLKAGFLNAVAKRFHGYAVGGFLLSICQRNDLWRGNTDCQYHSWAAFGTSVDSHLVKKLSLILLHHR
jgi:hypothetical protein